MRMLEDDGCVYSTLGPMSLPHCFPVNLLVNRLGEHAVRRASSSGLPSLCNTSFRTSIIQIRGRNATGHDKTPQSVNDQAQAIMLLRLHLQFNHQLLGVHATCETPPFCSKEDILLAFKDTKCIKSK